jgi:uncharacterized protein (DUF433 family)
MSRTPRTIRLPEPLQVDLEREFARRGVKEWSGGVIELLQEAVRMRRVPGISFVDSITGRRPVLAGTGLDVWEIIATWKVASRDEEKLRQTYHWLTPVQLRAALTYYRFYPEEIDQRIALDEEWTPERISEELPFAFLGPGITGKVEE